MKKVRLYIADMDELFVAKVRGIASRKSAIEIVGSSGDGVQAVRDIEQLMPDVLLTDTALPGVDGIALLRQSQRLKRPPVVVICTGFYSNASIERARRYGASFFLCKPVDPQSLSDMLVECGQCASVGAPVANNRDPEDAGARNRAAAVRGLLKQLGIPARLNGSAYIIEAVVRCNGNALLMKNLSKGLYAELAVRMDTTVARVERSMRSAIAIAWERGTLREHMPFRPSNKAFIEFVMRAVDEAELTQRSARP